MASNLSKRDEWVIIDIIHLLEWAIVFQLFRGVPKHKEAHCEQKGHDSVLHILRLPAPSCQFGG